MLSKFSHVASTRQESEAVHASSSPKTAWVRHNNITSEHEGRSHMDEAEANHDETEASNLTPTDCRYAIKHVSARSLCDLGKEK